MVSSIYLPRIRHLQAQLSVSSLDGIIVSKKENIHYLTGLKQVHPTNREALLFLTHSQSLLYHSTFTTPPFHPWLKSTPMDRNHPLKQVLSTLFSASNSQPLVIALEAHNLTVAELENIKQALPQVRFNLTNDLIETQRQIKDPTELKSIKKACRITYKTMAWITQDLLPRGARKVPRGWKSPLTEIELSRLIENHLYDLGADNLAFPTIVAFGKNSASPHHTPGKTKLAANSIVLLDFGCQVDGYCSDMTRTICLGPPPPRFLELERVTKSAATAALSLLNHHFNVAVLTHSDKQHLRGAQRSPTGETLGSSDGDAVFAKDVDIASRSVIDQAGLGQYFIHTTGHALGLEIHEQPSLNSQNQTPLKPGMVITLEPGIYLPGQFGYRHENTLLLN